VRGFRPSAAATNANLQRNCRQAIERGRAALEGMTEEQLMRPWRFMVQGRVMSEDPRYVVLVNALLSHLAHHRGQLTVYIRLLNASVPAIYGPSADEQG
jgi:uncharacterized damage-inducible protein DinB